MSASNGRQPWIKLNSVTFLAGLLTGGIVFGIAGVMWHNWVLKALSDDLTALERRVSLQRTDLNTLTSRVDSIASQANSLGNSVAALQESVPARLPTIREIIDQAKEIEAHNGRMDEIDRRLRAIAQAQTEQHTATCQSLAKLSAASARGSGC